MSSSRRAKARQEGSGRVRKPHAWPTPSSRGDSSRSLGDSLLLRDTAADFYKALHSIALKHELIHCHHLDLASRTLLSMATGQRSRRRPGCP